MVRVNLPESLYVQCMDYCIRRIEKSANGMVDCKDAIEKLGGSVAEDLLSRAFQLANKEKGSIIKKWRDEWRIFYTSKISSAILSWDEDLIIHVGNRCKNLKRVEVVHVKEFKPELVLKCPKTVFTLDFDGELIHRGMRNAFFFAAKDLRGGSFSSWLCDSEKIFRSLLIKNVRAPEFGAVCGGMSLSELHLGNVHAKAEDLTEIIRNCRNLRLLRHYQLVSSLYKMHSDTWRKKAPLPVYNLKNLDVDFSHVMRSRMSPEWVLSPDALHLAVKLCPRARSIRVRFDCNTPHDVLSPIATLESVCEFSAVCVSSGERSLLDFGDMTCILENHGPKSLRNLELKVIEEVEIHSLLENCKKLETLVLSGCGYVTPVTCNRYNCQSYGMGSLNKLRLLFYSNGDDFSWDHGVPECFWKATLLPAGANQIVRLEGIFLEYPRITRALTSNIFSASKSRLPFPQLIALSLCRYEEITVDEIAAICGLSRRNISENIPCSSLRYIRLSDCEKIDESDGKKLEKWLKQSSLDEICLHADR